MNTPIETTDSHEPEETEAKPIRLKAMITVVYEVPAEKVEMWYGEDASKEKMAEIDARADPVEFLANLEETGAIRWSRFSVGPMNDPPTIGEMESALGGFESETEVGPPHPGAGFEVLHGVDVKGAAPSDAPSLPRPDDVAEWAGPGYDDGEPIR